MRRFALTGMIVPSDDYDTALHVDFVALASGSPFTLLTRARNRGVPVSKAEEGIGD